MIYIPVPNAWPVCSRCKKPVDLLVEIVASAESMTFACMVECHGEREQVQFSGFDEVRRVHFKFGIEVFVPKQDGVTPVRRMIDL